MLEAGAAGEKVIEYSDWTFADRVSEALSVSLLGIGTVFAVLAVLWVVLEIFRFFFYDLPRRRSGEAKKEEKTAKPVKPAPVAAPVAPVANVSSDAELVAAGFEPWTGDSEE